MWGLGCLIWEVFNGTLPQTSALKSPGKVRFNHYLIIAGYLRYLQVLKLSFSVCFFTEEDNENNLFVACELSVKCDTCT